MIGYERLKRIWERKTPVDRYAWIKEAGFTNEAASKYFHLPWVSLPSYIQQALSDQEE